MILHLTTKTILIFKRPCPLIIPLEKTIYKILDFFGNKLILKSLLKKPKLTKLIAYLLALLRTALNVV